ncbi:M15 family metallopeptidase [Promicromonospora sukumoe]|uniref:M15 family metallopeptidase n=1 Tax=Promicromonospora sukumoe TaxID=88382 RepID=UPI0037C64295
MQDQATKPAVPTSSPSRRRLLRTTWAGAVATVTAGGLLLAAVPSIPDQHAPGDGRDLPARFLDAFRSVPAVQAETMPRNVTPDQIVAVLARADQQAREQGPDLSPAVAQAAAELGMLYTTYQIQQPAPRQAEGLRVQDAPVVRDRDADGDTDGNKGPDDNGAEPALQDDLQAVIQVSDEHGSTIEPAAERDAASEAAAKAVATRDAASAPRSAARRDPAEPRTGVPATAARPADVVPWDPTTGHGSAELGADRVTYDEVVLAAVRLANMLDPSAPSTLVEVQPADQHQAAREGTTAGAPGGRGGAGLTLRQNLFDVVDAFGDSTVSYANGRIPAAVLCPLDFASGHLLRCDAAERLEALSEKFEDEFGHPIPITDSYRSYVAQVAVASAKPHLAAVPGTSNHGWGLAVDLGAPISGGTSAEYVWLRVHGPDYGWDNPSWARPGGTKPEPWHFEFFAAGAVPDRAVDPSDVGTWGSDDETGRSDGEGPRYEAAATSSGTKDRSPADDAAPPSAKPADKPAKNPPAQKPTKPKPKPTPKPTPSEPKPTPKPPVTSPSPSPTPEPSPSPSPSDPGGEPSVPPSPSPSVPAPSPTPEPSAPSPAPSPTPSEERPSPTPEPTPSGSGTPSSPEPSSSPSATRESLLGLAKDLGLTDDDEG